MGGLDPLIQGALASQPKGPGDRPLFYPMLMFKVLVLQRLHGLADDATSFQITDRNSFRAFLGLTPGDAVSDGQTISDFSERLIATKTFESLFDTFLARLQKEHGLALAKEAVMVDASFAEVPRQRNSREDNALIKAGGVPLSLQDNARVKAHKALDARWTKKHNERHYGCKDHVKVDVKDKLILKAVITPASVQDCQAFDELIEKGDRVVHADCFVPHHGTHLPLRSRAACRQAVSLGGACRSSARRQERRATDQRTGAKRR